MGFFINRQLGSANSKLRVHSLAMGKRRSHETTQIRRGLSGSNIDPGAKARICSLFGCGGADKRDKAQRHQCDPGTAEQDACRIEHDISRETFEKLKACWETIAKGERKP